MATRIVDAKGTVTIPDPPIARLLFSGGDSTTTDTA